MWLRISNWPQCTDGIINKAIQFFFMRFFCSHINVIFLCVLRCLRRFGQYLLWRVRFFVVRRRLFILVERKSCGNQIRWEAYINLMDVICLLYFFWMAKASELVIWSSHSWTQAFETIFCSFPLYRCEQKIINERHLFVRFFLSHRRPRRPQWNDKWCFGHWCKLK